MLLLYNYKELFVDKLTKEDMMDINRPSDLETQLTKHNSTPQDLSFLKEGATTAKLKPVGSLPLALHIFFTSQNSWQHKQFSFTTNKHINIGSSNYNNTIPLHDENIDKLQAVILKNNQNWYFMNCGKEDKVHINGLLGKQLIIRGKSVNLVQVGKNFIVLAYIDKMNDPPQNINRSPDENECFVSFNDTEQYPFKVDEIALIGGNFLCSLFTANKHFLENVVEEDKELFKRPFLGFIFKYNDVLFFQSFYENIKLNNKNSFLPVLIQKTNNTIIFNKTVLNFNIPEFYIPKSSSLQLPTSVDTVFSLVPLDKTDLDLPEIQISTKMRSITIGRSSKESDVAINNPTISRKHAQLVIYPNSIMLYDYGSSNGTYINDEKVHKKTIKPGDRITFGDVEYFLCYAET